ncbi:hypothetical protein [Deefgea rivuli]|uniref:hypothetical protein n=1 Tax=Deefgea rivuli TaxID=400948 RepID=UPI0012EC8603|nr:hypothetical protein [Deefgea rivuli]
MEEPSMNPYDGIDYRYTSSDTDKGKATRLIQNILGFAPEINGLDYSLNFYSGGSGVDDRVAIRCNVTPSDWSLVIAKLNLKPPSEVLQSPDWGEDLAELVSNCAAPSDISADCCNFVNANKKVFQDTVSFDNALCFSVESNVNTWCVVWVVGEHLNYLSFDQG